MDTETFKSQYQSMIDILMLAPARQAQTYYNIIVDTTTKSITVNPTLEYFLSNRTRATGEGRLQALMREAEFHTGLAIGCLESWLDSNNIEYTTETNFDKDNFVTIRIS